MKKLKNAILANNKYLREKLNNPIYWLTYPQWLRSQFLRENKALFPQSTEYKIHSDDAKMRSNCLSTSVSYILNNNNRPIDEFSLAEINRLICNGTEITGGAIRTRPVDLQYLNIAPPSINEIYYRLNDVCYSLNQPSANPLLTAIEAHYQLIAIQPFSDANKRTARMVMNWYLIKNGCIPIIFSEPGDRDTYIESIRAKSTDNESYIRAMLEIALRTQTMTITKLVAIANGKKR